MDFGRHFIFPYDFVRMELATSSLFQHGVEEL